MFLLLKANPVVKTTAYLIPLAKTQVFWLRASKRIVIFSLYVAEQPAILHQAHL